MGGIVVCERPPIPHPKSNWDGLPRPRPVKSHHTLVQHSRFFPALVTTAKNHAISLGQHHFYSCCGPLLTIIVSTGAMIAPVLLPSGPSAQAHSSVYSTGRHI